MHVHPAIAALRTDPVSQRRSQAIMEAAMNEWRCGAGIAQVAADFEEYARGEMLHTLPALVRLFNDPEQSTSFCQSFVASICSGLRSAPLGEIPLRHGSSEGFARLQLMQQGGSVLSLCAYEPVTSIKEPETAQFADNELHETVIAGKARIARHKLDGKANGDVAVTSGGEQWQAGVCASCLPLCEARHIVEVEQSLLLLQLSRAPQSPRPSKVYRLSDAALIQQVSGDKRASEHVMALAVLGALKDRNAQAPMVSYALDDANDADARWEAVRQALAMDAARGMALLEQLARKPDDPLAMPATKLRTHLLQTHPSLQNLISEAA